MGLRGYGRVVSSLKIVILGMKEKIRDDDNYIFFTSFYDGNIVI